MKLIVDGEIYRRQVKGGISRIYNEVLPRLCELEPMLEIKILTDGRLKQALPRHPRISHHRMPPYHRYFRPGRLWKPLVTELKLTTRRWQTGETTNALWQATYYTPPKRWSGAFIVFFHDLLEEHFPEFFNLPRHDHIRNRKRVCAQKADIIICNSHTTQRDVCSYYGVPEEKTRVVTLAMSDIFHPLSPEEQSLQYGGRPFILFVGNRSPYKNFDFLLQAYSTWPGRDDIDLLVVGPAWTQEEITRLRKLGIAGSVQLQEYVSDEVLCNLYNQAKAFIYPSFYEGFGIPLLEAMACGCPIVASVIPSTQEVAADYPHYFQLTDSRGLQDALDRALRAGREDKKLDAARRHASHFSWQVTAQQMLSIYKEILSK